MLQFPPPFRGPIRMPLNPPHVFSPVAAGNDPQHQQASYEGITSPVFTKQVPPQTLPHLRFPPPFPPIPGCQPIWNPYIISSFSPQFAELFEAMLNPNFNPGSKGTTFNAAIKAFRNLPIEKQLEEFMYCRTLSVDQVRVRWQLVLDLLFILRQYYPLCEVHAFGSVISGLGDLSSDIDIFVNIRGNSDNSAFPAVDALNCVKRVLKPKSLKCPHSGQQFLNNQIIPISKARVPILKIQHALTSINCDLSFENRLSAQNSKLMVLYTNVDARVFRLMVIIRYWLKLHHLSGPNDIKNYALNLLVLVYLMKKDIIPSVYTLQCLKEGQRREQGLFLNVDEIDGWDASFCEEPEFIAKNFESCPLPVDFHEKPTRYLIDLALGFFKMCSQTDFSKVVVCPFLGEIILKGGFIPGNEQFLTDMFGRYKQFAEENDISSRLKINTYLCIQDPFVLNFNVTAGAPVGTVVRFQLACAKILEVMTQKFLEEDKEPVSLLDLFTPVLNEVPFRNKDISGYYKATTKWRRLKKEILGALGLPLNYFEEKADEVMGAEDEGGKQESNLVKKLPRHLLPLDKLLSRRWRPERQDEIINLEFSAQFAPLYLAEVARCRMIEGDGEPIKDVDKRNALLFKLLRKMVSLWSNFGKEFLDDFFDNALKLEIIGDVREASLPACQVEIKEFDGADVRPNLKVSVPCNTKERGENVKEDFKKKITEIGDGSDSESEDDLNHYRLMTVKVTYPIWKRPYVLKEWKEGEFKKRRENGGMTEYEGNPIEVESKISEWYLKNNTQQKEQPNKENIIGQDDDDGKREEEGGREDVEVLVEIPKKKRARIDDESFTPFNVDVFVKISTKLLDVNTRKLEDALKMLKRPYASLVFKVT